ncbi:hypothetical protein [Polaribacter porphyrae]|uniref:Uncharacterized protein n=1 Tax=Polaribacter porphyrae TaxID=1137780 RepID=A0A2S7WNX5_9FLAO|nr:hypothetical protein [Polaribacter porphyrae]PQJ79315.1 hypothetical protein BTO18_09085 [Polaribacter porphyrae]
MLNAILENKFNLVKGLKEDSLTSSVFDYLFMLPDNIIWHIMKNSCVDNKNLPENVGEFIDCSFWPKWDTKSLKLVTNSRFIEPDLFVEFENYFVIIESKRYDKDQQDVNQWKNQIKTFSHIYGEENKELIYFAVGGIWSSKTENSGIEDKLIHKIKWQNLLDIIIKTKNRLTKNIDILPVNRSYVRILETILKGLEIHGYNNFLWLNSLKRNQIEMKEGNKIKEWITKI